MPLSSMPTEVGFFLLSRLLQCNIPQKQADNIVSSVHETGATCLSLLIRTKTIDFPILRNFSTVYFIHDILQMIYNYKKINVMNIGYLYHHLASIYLLNSSVNTSLVTKIFFWAELSNLPTYPLYHYLHQKGDHKDKIKKLQMLQKIVFTGIRVIVISKMIHRYLKEKGGQNIPKPLLAVLPIYFMGLAWTYKILRQ